MKNTLVINTTLALAVLAGAGVGGFTAHMKQNFKTTNDPTTSLRNSVVKNENLDIKVPNKALDSQAKIWLTWTNKTESNQSKEISVVNSTKYASSFTEFVQKYPTVTLRLIDSTNYMTYVGIGNKKISQGSHFFERTFATSSLWASDLSTRKTILNTYEFSNTNTNVKTNAYLDTRIVNSDNGALLKMRTEAYVWGRAGLLSKWKFAFSENSISDIVFNHASYALKTNISDVKVADPGNIAADLNQDYSALNTDSRIVDLVTKAMNQKYPDLNPVLNRDFTITNNKQGRQQFGSVVEFSVSSLASSTKLAGGFNFSIKLQTVDLSKIITHQALGNIAMKGTVPTKAELLAGIKAKNPAANNLTTSDFDFKPGCLSSNSATIVGLGNYKGEVFLIFDKERTDLGSLPSQMSVALSEDNLSVGSFKTNLADQIKTTPGYESITLEDLDITNANGSVLNESEINHPGTLSVLVSAKQTSAYFFGFKLVNVNISLVRAQIDLMHAKRNLNQLSSQPISITLTSNVNRFGLFTNALVGEIQKQAGFDKVQLKDLILTNSDGIKLSYHDIYEHALTLNINAQLDSKNVYGHKIITVNIAFQFTIQGKQFHYADVNNWLHHAGYMTEYTSEPQLFWDFKKSGVNSWEELKSLFGANAKAYFDQETTSVESFTYPGYKYKYPVTTEFNIPDVLFSQIKDGDSSSDTNKASACWSKAYTEGLTTYHYIYMWHNDHAIYFRYQWGVTTSYYLNPWYYSVNIFITPTQIK